MIVRTIKTVKIVTGGIRTARDVMDGYSVAKTVIGEEGMDKIRGTLAKKAASLIEPAMASDPDNPYEAAIAELQEILDRPALAELAAGKRPSDDKILGALLAGERATAVLIGEWRDMNDIKRDFTFTAPEKDSDAPGGVFNSARGFLYHQRKSGEIGALSAEIQKRERETITELAKNPLAGAIMLDAPKVFERLLEATLESYLRGGTDRRNGKRYVILKGTTTGDHRIYGRDYLETDRYGKGILHLAVEAPSDFYIGKLTAQRTKLLEKQLTQRVDGMTPFMKLAEKGKFAQLGQLLQKPEYKDELTQCSDEGSSLFDIALDSGEKEDALPRVKSFLDALTQEQKDKLLNTPGKDGQFPLQRVSLLDISFAKLLYDNGARQGLSRTLFGAIKQMQDQPSELKERAQEIIGKAAERLPELAETAREAGARALQAGTEALGQLEAAAPEMARKVRGVLGKFGIK